MTQSAPAKDELIAVARELRPSLAERAAVAERERRLPQETIDELQSAGFYKYMVPKKFGGHGGSILGLVELCAELAKGDASTAWVYMNTGCITAFVGAYLPEEGARAVYDSTDKPIVAGVNGFTGTAHTSGSDYVVTGSWAFASGCLHANWFFGGVLIKDENNEMINQGWAFIPMSELSIKDTWHVAGMKATGSNTVIANQVRIPAHLMMTMDRRLGQEKNPAPDAEILERMPFAALFSVGLTGTCLGTVQAAAELISDNAHKRGISYFDFAKQTESGALLERLGRAKMKLDTAWLHVRRGGEALHGALDGPLDYATRARTRADAGHAVETLREAMDILLNIGGASCFAESSPMQRYWRDFSVASRHAMINSGPLYEAYARAELGVEPNITPYI